MEEDENMKKNNRNQEDKMRQNRGDKLVNCQGKYK